MELALYDDPNIDRKGDLTYLNNTFVLIHAFFISIQKPKTVTSYLLFCKQHRKKIVEQNPGLGNTVIIQRLVNGCSAKVMLIKVFFSVRIY